MTINIWTKDLKDCYLWTSKVKEIYVGASKVYPSIVNFATQWPCPDGFHVPLTTEWNDLYKLLRAVWTLNITNFNTRLKIPNMWCRKKSDWSLMIQWSEPDYWSSSCKDNWSWYFFSYSGDRFYPQNSWDTWYWFPVRAFKNEAAVPDSSWTVIYENWVKKICHSSTLWLISISSDWTNWTTIADKNVWATTVWNYWDTLSASNCWWYFQQWNNYMFPYSWNITTSSNQVNASTYWPWNYYNSSTFITNSNKTWDSSVNLNLWWWVDWNVPVS